MAAPEYTTSWCKGSPVARNASEVLTKKKYLCGMALKSFYLADPAGFSLRDYPRIHPPDPIRNCESPQKQR
jgi:hypothetical protein